MIHKPLTLETFNEQNVPFVVHDPELIKEYTYTIILIDHYQCVVKDTNNKLHIKPIDLMIREKYTVVEDETKVVPCYECKDLNGRVYFMNENFQSPFVHLNRWSSPDPDAKKVVVEGETRVQYLDVRDPNNWKWYE